MSYEVLIMPSAEAELEAAYLWIAERNPDAAAKWYNGVLDAFLTLETLSPVARGGHAASNHLQRSINRNWPLQRSTL